MLDSRQVQQCLWLDGNPTAPSANERQWEWQRLRDDPRYQARHHQPPLLSASDVNAHDDNGASTTVPARLTRRVPTYPFSGPAQEAATTSAQRRGNRGHHHRVYNTYAQYAEDHHNGNLPTQQLNNRKRRNFDFDIGSSSSGGDDCDDGGGLPRDVKRDDRNENSNNHTTTHGLGGNDRRRGRRRPAAPDADNNNTGHHQDGGADDPCFHSSHANVTRYRRRRGVKRCEEHAWARQTDHVAMDVFHQKKKKQTKKWKQQHAGGDGARQERPSGGEDDENEATGADGGGGGAGGHALFLPKQVLSNRRNYLRFVDHLQSVGQFEARNRIPLRERYGGNGTSRDNADGSMPTTWHLLQVAEQALPGSAPAATAGTKSRNHQNKQHQNNHPHPPPATTHCRPFAESAAAALALRQAHVAVSAHGRVYREAPPPSAKTAGGVFTAPRLRQRAASAGVFRSGCGGNAAVAAKKVKKNEIFVVNNDPSTKATAALQAVKDVLCPHGATAAVGSAFYSKAQSVNVVNREGSGGSTGRRLAHALRHQRGDEGALIEKHYPEYHRAFCGGGGAETLLHPKPSIPIRPLPRPPSPSKRRPCAHEWLIRKASPEDATSSTVEDEAQANTHNNVVYDARQNSYAHETDAEYFLRTSHNPHRHRRILSADVKRRIVDLANRYL